MQFLKALNGLKVVSGDLPEAESFRAALANATNLFQIDFDTRVKVEIAAAKEAARKQAEAEAEAKLKAQQEQEKIEKEREEAKIAAEKKSSGNEDAVLKQASVGELASVYGVDQSSTYSIKQTAVYLSAVGFVVSLLF
jgi:flagellar biosynthesis/type III secretory pathway protein FliH